MSKLIADITQNILSDYIEYDELLELMNSIPNLKVNPNRIRVIEGCDVRFEQIPTKYTYIDGVLRKEEGDAGWREGDLKSEYNYNKDGQKEGKQYVWHSDDIKESEENYKNGERDGKQYSWYHTGQLREELNYQNGKKEGKQYSHWGGGGMRYEENYKNGERDQTQYYWKTKNSLKPLEYTYENGKFVK